MRILYLGVSSGTSLQRAKALARLGHAVRLIDPDSFLPGNALLRKFHWETGGALVQQHVRNQILAAVANERYDLTWVGAGRYVGPSLITELQRRFGPVVNYNTDDPLGKRDRASWLLYRRSIAKYDLVVVVREPNVAEARRRGAKKVLRVFMSADEVAHAPRELTDADHALWDSDVLFVGTWFPERGPFMAELRRRGVPLTIHGDRWHKAREWPLLRDVWRGPGTNTDDDYAKAIQCAKISLGLLSKGNRDLHTQRTLEIPLLGGLFCAERTPEHQHLYCEGQEAVFWSDAAECAAVCHRLLADGEKRGQIARNGRLRCLENGHLNEQVVARALAEVGRT